MDPNRSIDIPWDYIADKIVEWFRDTHKDSRSKTHMREAVQWAVAQAIQDETL